MQTNAPQPSARFDTAVQATISGDLVKLGALLRDSPNLIRERSSSPHRATLLHYVAANGVEDKLQISPPNGAEVTRLLNEAGAEVDAPAETYGGGPLQTTVNLLVSSVHPAKAGTQVPILDALLDAGAAIEGVENDGSPLLTAIAFAYTPAVDRLVQRGARVETLLAAAGAGHLPRVQSFFGDNGALKDTPLPRVPWIGPLASIEDHLGHALLFASLHSRLEVMEYLLDHGADVNAKVRGETCLHQAACRSHMPVIKFLLEHSARTDVRDDKFDGTPLGWAEHCNQPEAAELLRRFG